MISVLMPAYNEGRHIRRNLEETALALDDLGLAWEIVVCDDGSRDNTRQEAEQAAAALTGVTVIGSGGNRGKGYALRKAFSRSRGDLIFFLDSDLDIHPRQFATLLKVMDKTGSEIVIGSKRHPDSTLNYPRGRKLISAAYFFLVKSLFGLPLRDTQTGIKLFRRQVLEETLPRLLVKKYAFDLELLVAAHRRGFLVAEAPVVVDYRGRFGSIGFDAIWTMLLDTLAVFYRAAILKFYDRKLPVAETLPEASIVIAYRERTPYLDECLSGIAGIDYPRVEVILLPDEPEEHSGPWRVIPTGSISPPLKRDIGWRAARGEIIAFLDDDCIPEEDWLRNAARRLSDSAVAAVGGPGTTPPSDPPRAQAGGKVLASFLVSGLHAYRVMPRMPREVDDYPTCNLLVRREMLERTGGFSCPYWPGEDTVLCLKIHEAGGRIAYDPDVEVRHHRRPLFRRHWKQVGNYGLHRGFFTKIFPQTSRRFSYYLPSLWLVFLATGWLPALVLKWWAGVYLIPVGIYLAAVLLTAARHVFSPKTALLVLAGIISTHLVYGARFIQGLFSRRMPEETKE